MNNQDAWNLAMRIIGVSKDAFFKVQLQEIFPECNEPFEILSNFTFEECSARVEDWEKCKRIHIGDVVSYCLDNTLGVVLDVSDEGKNIYHVYTEHGCVEQWGKSRIEKSGKSVNLLKLFEQII